MQRREAADLDLKQQLAQEKAPEMQDKVRECQEAQESLDLIERKLGKIQVMHWSTVCPTLHQLEALSCCTLCTFQ